MAQERKLSILQSLLARVQARTTRASVASADARPQSALQKAAFEEEVTTEAVPPSAPRVRETALDSLSEDNQATRKHAIVPEEARPASDASELEEEPEEIDITVSESEAEDMESEPPAASLGQEDGVDGRLVLENETPLPGIAAEPPPPAPRDDLSWPPPAPPVEPPPVETPRVFAPPAPPPAPAYEPPPEPTAAFAVASAAPEVHRAPAPRGPAGTFIEQSRTFSPRSFGELLEASLGLGRDE
jgi:hypothetical protein